MKKALHALAMHIKHVQITHLTLPDTGIYSVPSIQENTLFQASLISKYNFSLRVHGRHS